MPRSPSVDATTTERLAVDPPVRHRAAALPPEERRAAIVAATIPLLLSHGAAITTRQIAEAAGIAEGTIFRVFPDKDSLIEAAIETAFDDAPVDEALRAIDPSLGLEERLALAVEIIELRVTSIWQLMTAVGMSKIPDKRPSHRGPPDLGSLAALFEPDRDRLATDPTTAAHLLRGMTFANSHPAFAPPDHTLSSAEIVMVLLDGIRRPDGS